MPVKKKTLPVIESDIKLIRKANELVEARYKFDIWETRVFAYMLTLIKANDTDFREYEINTGDIVREFALHDSGIVYESVKTAGDKLLDKKVNIIRTTAEGRKEQFNTHLVASTATPEERGKGDYIKLSFHPALKPFLLELKERYLVYDIRNILSLTSIYSVRLFELLKQYQKIGKRKFRVDELKELLSIEPNEYQLYGHFKELIKRAERDLAKHTDIYFTFEEEIVKRKCVSITFYIYENTKNKRTKPQEVKSEDNGIKLLGDNNNINRIYETVKKYISKRQVKKWLDEYSIEQIERGIQYTRNYIQAGNKVDNIGGMLNSMVGTPNIVDKFESEKQEYKRKLNKIEENEQKQEQERKYEAETKKIIHNYEQEKKKSIRDILHSNPELAKRFLDNLRMLKESEKHEFLIDIAFDNYKTNIENIKPNSVEEVLFNYEQGGSFGAYILDCIEKEFPEYVAMRKEFEEQLKQR